MEHGYTYEAALANAQRVNWTIDDIIGGENRLDFAKPFLPESSRREESRSKKWRRRFARVDGLNEPAVG